MTLLTLAQDILKETKNPSIPLTIIGNNGSNSAVQVLSALTDAVKYLAEEYEWQELEREYSFTSVANQRSYALPEDFDFIKNETFWNVYRRWNCIGPMSPPDWRVLVNSLIGGGAICDYFRISNNNIDIFPTPPSAVNYIYTYQTNLIVKSDAGVGQTTWLADTDVPAIKDDHMLKLAALWRFLKNQGLPYEEEQLSSLAYEKRKKGVNGGKRKVTYNSRYLYGRVGFPQNVQSPI